MLHSDRRTFGLSAPYYRPAARPAFLRNPLFHGLSTHVLRVSRRPKMARSGLPVRPAIFRRPRVVPTPSSAGSDRGRRSFHGKGRYHAPWACLSSSQQGPNTCAMFSGANETWLANGRFERPPRMPQTRGVPETMATHPAFSATTHRASSIPNFRKAHASHDAGQLHPLHRQFRHKLCRNWGTHPRCPRCPRSPGPAYTDAARLPRRTNMNEPTNKPVIHEPSAVHDVRRIRSRFDRESHGDIRRHVAESKRVAGLLREELGLKMVPLRPATPIMPGQSD
jgi:hypothetical protein